MELYKIKNLSFKYNNSKTNVLENISFDIHSGEFLTIFGETGSGKTTLLKLLKRQLAPKGIISGEIYYQDKLLKDVSEDVAAFEVGFVMQNPDYQIVTDKVWSELAFGLENLSLDQKEIKRRIAEICGFFGITSWYHKNTIELSGGQKQILNLAAIMVMNPKILILDEPTAQLDPIAAMEFIQTLKRINDELGTTILIVEHRLEEVIPVSDRVLLIDDKHVEIIATPKDLGSLMIKLNKDRMSLALPSSMRIFYKLGGTGASPVTVKEGIEYLRNYKNEQMSLGSLEGSEKSKTIAIEIKEGFFRYERDLPDILNGLNLEVFKNEFLIIVGDNGVGKSTLLKVISGNKRLYHGKFRIWDKKLKAYSKKELYRNQIAFLPQNPESIFVKESVYLELVDSCKVMGYKKEEYNLEIEKIAKFLEIENLYNQHPYDLSGGEQQKLALAKIILMKPKILLLDEPTKGMDAYSKFQFASKLKELQASGLTIIMVSHDIEFAAEYADRVGMYFDGEIISLNDPVSFFKGNQYYTTAAYRISSNYFSDATTVDRVVELCKLNGKVL